MLQWLYTYVAMVCYQCFTCVFGRISQVCLSGCCIYFIHLFQKHVISVCFIHMLQVFYLNVAHVASVLSECYTCCSGYTHMLQAYVLNVSSILDVCCSKSSMLQVFHET
jgi:hypothetical protein